MYISFNDSRNILYPLDINEQKSANILSFFTFFRKDKFNYLIDCQVFAVSRIQNNRDSSFDIDFATVAPLVGFWRLKIHDEKSPLLRAKSLLDTEDQ